MTSDAAKTARYLEDLRSFGQEAAYLISLGREAYLAHTHYGRLLRNAGERTLIKVANVVEYLPKDFKAQYPTVNWVAIQRMRNLVAHHCDHVDDDLMWAALQRRIPDLLETLDLGKAAAKPGESPERRA
jgi:uncharacterized protein with HEPN domain